MNPQIKKLLSALLVAALGAMLVVLGNYVPHLPEGLQALAVAVLASVAHYLPALGTQQVVAQQIMVSPRSLAQVAAGAPLKPPPLPLLCICLCAILGLFACSAAQDKSEATYAAIVGGCKVSLDLDRDAGAAGAVDDEAHACDKTLKVWEKRP